MMLGDIWYRMRDYTTIIHVQFDLRNERAHRRESGCNLAMKTENGPYDAMTANIPSS